MRMQQDKLQLNNFMTSQYQSLKQEAQIYENLTGKKCSVYHNNRSSQQNLIKLPKAINRRIMTIDNYQQRYALANNRSGIERRQKKSSLKQPNDLFQVILKQGIKMTITQDNKPTLQKISNYRNKTSQIHKKFSQNPEETFKTHLHSLRKLYSENKINISDSKTHKTKTNIESSPSIANHSEILPLQRIEDKKFIKFLTLNNNNQVSSYKKRPIHQIKQYEINETIGKSKKERQLLEKRNQQESRLQQEFRQYHQSTNEFIEEIKAKYHLNFLKDKKYLHKFKNYTVSLLTQEHQKTILVNQAINIDRLSTEISHLNTLLQDKKRKLQSFEQIIAQNEFQQYLQPNTINKQQVIIQQQADSALSFQKKMSIIDKLRASLINLRLKNEEQRAQRDSKPIKINERLKQLLFN